MLSPVFSPIRAQNCARIGDGSPNPPIGKPGAGGRQCRRDHIPQNRTPTLQGRRAVLVECGFLSNPEEAAKLLEKDYQKKLSFCIFYAIMEE